MSVAVTRTSFRVAVGAHVAVVTDATTGKTSAVSGTGRRTVVEFTGRAVKTWVTVTLQGHGVAEPSIETVMGTSATAKATEACRVSLWVIVGAIVTTKGICSAGWLCIVVDDVVVGVVIGVVQPL